MTSTTATEVVRRGAARTALPRTMREAMIVALRRAFPPPRDDRIAWPSEHYQRDPVAFAREVLGMQPTARQCEILDAIRDHRRVAVRSCNKAGKSEACAMAALWFYCCFVDARVVLTATTARQVDGILWRAIRKLVQRAKFKIDGDPGVLARTGIKAPDFREIVGFTARESEAVAGVSGANILYIADEASGIDELLFEAIDGNLAGDGRVVMISNPTRTEGRFFDAFHSRSAHYRTIHVTAMESPNYIAGAKVVPGLATREWVDEMRAEYGEDSPFYKVRVLGEFVVNEEGKVLSIAAITEAELRWDDTPATGRLVIGLDPAGPGEGGDETAAAVRRGQKILRVLGWHGLTDDAIVMNVLGLILEHKESRETPVVVLDCLGPIGSVVHGKLRLAAEQHRGAFEVWGVRGSDRACREPQNYDRMRDELWANLVRWVRDGGALPADIRLSKELHAPSWESQINGRLKVTPKPELRQVLGRSPDRADAVCLAVWEPMAMRPHDGSARQETEPSDEGQPLDAYSGLDVWQR
jgi:phage terminase large subunit